MPEMPSLAEEMLATQKGMCSVEIFGLSVEYHDHFISRTHASLFSIRELPSFE